MSDQAIHGKGQYVEIEDPDNPGTFIDISDKCFSASQPFSRANVPTNGFGEGDIISIVGQRDSSFAFSAFMDDELRDILHKWFLDSDDPCQINYGPEGNATSKPKLSSDFWVLGFSEGGDVSSALTTAPSLQRTGSTTRGTWS
jgi:hypothetical protein